MSSRNSLVVLRKKRGKFQNQALFCVLTIYRYMRIAKLTELLPIANLVMVWVFAFTRWPAIASDRRP